MADPQYEATQGGFSYRCDNCGAQMRFDAAAGQLVCDACGARKAAAAAKAVGGAPSAPGVPGQVLEYPLEQGLQFAKSGGGAQVESSRCDECGAVVQFAAGITATKCAFCDSPKVLAQKTNAGIQPESLVPFTMDQPKAKAAFEKWMKKLWFRPSDLKKNSSINELRGVYVPYWTFDARAYSEWQAEAGYHYFVNEPYHTTENGKSVVRTRSVRHTRWEHARGTRDDFYDDQLVCASKGLPADLVKRLQNFKTKDLVPYQPSYVAGWSAESAAIGIEPAWGTAQKEILSDQEAKCLKDVPGQERRNFRMQTQLGNQTFKHCLLPIWIAAFRYRDKVFRFLVNGQTGNVTGKAPYSWVKITLFVLMLLGIMTTIIVLIAVNTGNSK